MKQVQKSHNEEIRATLMHKGKVAAWKVSMKLLNLRLEEARKYVEKIALEIQPGQANG